MRVAQKDKEKAGDPKAGEALKDFLARFAYIMDDAQEAVYAMDSSGKFIYVNKKGIKKLGLTSINDIVGIDFRSIIDPEYLQATVNNFLRRLKGEDIPPYEISINPTPGKKIFVELTSSPIIINNAVVGEWGVGRDITERKEREAQITAQSHLLQEEVEARIKEARVYERNIEIFTRDSNDAILIIDPERNINSWNRGAESIFGHKAEEMIGKPLSSIIPPELKIEFDEVIAEVERRGYIRNFETDRIKKDGARIIIQSTINVIKDEKGQVLGFAEVSRDITDQKRLQQELVRSKLELEQAYEKLKQHNIKLEDSVRLLESTLKIKPVRELASTEEETPGEDYKLDPRRCYLVKDSDPSAALSVFARIVLTQGMHGLLITRTLPQRIREKYGLLKTPIVWLTTNRVQGETCVSPSAIAELSGLLVGFLDQTKDGIILIDGLEYMISQNNFRSILNLLQLMNDKIMISDSRLVINLDPATLDEKEVHLVQKEAAEFLHGKEGVDFSRRYEHLLDRFKYEPDRPDRT
jgi:PAS domain S-box-containing protein